MLEERGFIPSLQLNKSIELWRIDERDGTATSTFHGTIHSDEVTNFVSAYDLGRSLAIETMREALEKI